MNTAGLLALAIALVVAVVVVFPLGKALRRHPAPFYFVAIVLTALYAWALFSSVSLNPVRPLAIVLQKGYLASIFLGVVMFTGVLDEGTSLRKRLQPIRGELSILSFIFILGHLLTYLPSYLPRLGILLTSRTNIALSLGVAIVLTVIFCVLSFLSLRILRRKMNARLWKNIQRFSYLMVLLLVLHVGLVLGRSAFMGGVTVSTVSFWTYIIIVALYAVLRIRKAVRDRARRHNGTVDADGDGAAPAARIAGETE